MTRRTWTTIAVVAVGLLVVLPLVGLLAGS